MVVIYKITSPDNKIYIGQTWNFKRRMSEYKSLNFRKQVYLYNSFNKYGFDKHCFDIVHEFPNDISQEIVHQYELLYWQQYKDCGFQMMNLTTPGVGPGRMSLETKSKISKSHKGKKLSPVTIEKMKLAQKNRNPISNESRKKMSDAKKGKKQSKETIEKRIGHRRGKSLPQEAKRSGSKMTVEKVIEIKNLLQEFKSAYKVHKILSDPNISINMVVNIAYNRAWKHVKI